MTTAISNVANTDIVDLTLEQAGASRTEVYLEEPLLDATKDYMVSCSEFAAPLSEEGMITYNIATSVLLTIRRRFVGAAVGAPNNIVPPEYYPQLALPQILKMYSPADFMTFVAQWCSQFSKACYALGFDFVDTIPPNHRLNDDRNIEVREHQLLSFAITPGGVPIFRGSAKFWRNFYIEAAGDLATGLKSYAQTLFGLSERELALTNDGGGISNTATLLVNAGQYTDSNIANTTQNYGYMGDHSLFRYLDERMYISLEADLALPFNQLIRDGVETKTHEIATFPFQTKYKTTIKMSDNVVQSALDIEMDTYVSRTHFQSKTDPTFSWYPLKSSYMVQNMRLSIFITRRRFINNRWMYTREPVKIHQDGVWNASLKFVSVH